MPRLIKTVTIIPGILTQVSFKNANGKFHRVGGPAVIWIYNDGSRRYFYYCNGNFYRPPLNGQEQPAVIKVSAAAIHYAYFTNNSEYASRENVNLPKNATLYADGNYKLIYHNHTVIGNHQDMKIFYSDINDGRFISYHCGGLIGRRCLNGEWTDIPLNSALERVKIVQRRGFSELPLSHFMQNEPF